MLSGGADGVILGSVPADRSLVDLETMAELATRGVVQLVFSDTLVMDGVDVLPPGRPTPDGAGPLFEQAVAVLAARLRAGA
jgi:hypothetical protein